LNLTDNLELFSFLRETNKEDDDINDSALISLLEIIKEDDDINNSALISFLEEIKEVYQNCGLQFRTALDKFVERYHASKSISIARLSSFLYSIDRNIDAKRVKSGVMICVQVESVKRRKLEGSNDNRRKLPVIVNVGKENSDPQTIPSQKKRKTSKKEHNLSKNVLKNQLN
jgi:hypothetical protein